MYIKQLVTKSKSIPESSTVVVGATSLSEYASKNLRVHVVASSIVGAPIIKIQGKIVGGDWFDYSSTNSSITLLAGNNSITMNVEDVTVDIADMPLCNDLRVVVVTGAGVTADIDSVAIQL